MSRWHRPLVALGLLAPACSPAPTAHRSTQSSATPPAESGTDATAAPAATSTVPAPMESAGAGLPSPAPAGPTAVVSGLPPDTEGTTTTRVRPRPTTTLPEDVDEDLSDDEWWAKQPGAPTAGRAALLACIRSYEGDYGTNTGNGYYGAYQFDLQTWRSVGGTGLPSDASPAEQDMRAGMLIDRRGLAPWPTPARRCS